MNDKRKFKRVLVANRGEIAIRIFRACKELGIRSVAIYSEEDKNTLFRTKADESYQIGKGKSPVDAYLAIDEIIELAKAKGVDAIHPGYGFLSENVEFAKACEEEGLVFIGPDYHMMDNLGDKVKSKIVANNVGVPTIPGITETVPSEEVALQFADECGYPVMLKAAAGGGGRGMRIVRSKEEMVEQYRSAKSEAKKAFGIDDIFIEKYLERPKHIEVQVLGDSYGNVVHLFDRECSVQRRNQKIVEESPSPFLTPELRREMGEKAVAAARAVNYRGAGTIEFLVDKYRHFYFLEMNTRLQVEHPITEEVVGVDLVKEQLHVAGGEALRFKQEDLFQRGHAIECRICAEDTENGFIPCPGIIRQLTEPNGIGVRIDSYVYEGYEIPLYYDPMIGKLIVWATNRQFAIERMRRVLYEFKITGLKTNISYLRRIMYAPAFVKGEYDTSFLSKYSRSLQRSNGENEEIENMAMIAAYVDYLFNLEENSPVRTTDSRPISRWREFGLQKGVLRI